MSFLLKTTKMQVDKFLKIINATSEEVAAIVNQIDSYYIEHKEYKKDKAGEIKHKNGKPQFRIIRPSKGRLKVIQNLIYKNILSKIIWPEFLTGGIKNRSSIQNAAKHKGKKYKFQTDLKSFFDTVSHHQVNEALLLNGFGNQVSHLITKLTTYKGCLPQGASTSTALANLVFLSIDFKIQSLCESNKITYTRYVDDITLSSQFDFKELTGQILEIVQSEGFKISHKKTNYKSRAVITGVVVSQNEIDVTPEFLAKKNRPGNSPNQQKGLDEYYRQVKIANKKSDTKLD